MTAMCPMVNAAKAAAFKEALSDDFVEEKTDFNRQSYQ